MRQDEQQSTGRRRIPESEKKWFSKIVRILFKESGLPQVDFAAVLDVSRSWVTRALRGDYGPWPRPIFEDKIKTLVEEGYLDPEHAEKILTEFALQESVVRPPQLVYLRTANTILEPASPQLYLSEDHKTDDKDSNVPEKLPIVERREEAEVITALRRGRRIILLVGPQASGKTTLVRQVIEQVQNELSAYVINAREITGVSLVSIAQEVNRIDDRRSLLIIEDAHVNPQHVNSLVQGFLEMRLNCLITARPSYKDQFLWDQRNLLAQIENGKLGYGIRIDTSDKSYRTLMVEITKRTISAFKRTTTTEAVNEFIHQSGNDLWALLFLVQATQGTNVDWQVVYRTFYERFVSLNREKEHAAAAMIAVAAFWQYELPITGNFLKLGLGIENQTLRFLSDQGYLLHDSIRDLYSVQHASVAKHYIKTAKLFPHLSENLYSTEQEQYLDIVLLIRYLEHDPHRVYEVFRHIRYFPSIIEVCLSKTNIREIVFSAIHNPDEPLSLAADLISDIALFGPSDVRKVLLENLKPEIMKIKLDRCENLGAIAYFLESLPWDRKQGWSEVIDKVNSAAVIVGGRSFESKDQRLVYCPFTVQWEPKQLVVQEMTRLIEAGDEVGSRMKQEQMLLADAQLCCKSGDIPTMCLKGTLHTPSRISIEIVQMLDENTLTAKLISSSADVVQAAKLISVLAWTERSLIERLIKDNTKALLKMLQRAKYTNTRNMLLWTLQNASPLFFEDMIWNELNKDIKTSYKEMGWYR